MKYLKLQIFVNFKKVSRQLKKRMYSYDLSSKLKILQAREISICDRAYKNQKPIQNQNYLLPTKNYCLTFPLSPLQITEQKNYPLRSNCHLKLHFSVIKKSTFRTQTPESM